MGGDRVTRRNLLKLGLGGAAGLGALVAGRDTIKDGVGTATESAADIAEQLQYSSNFLLNRMDWRNINMLKNGPSHLSGSSAMDFEYSEHQFWRKLHAFLEGATTGEHLNGFQRYAAEDAHVGHRDSGFGAGITTEGRISSLWFPHTGFTQHIPYHVHGTGELQGADPFEGIFAGIAEDNSTTYLWEDVFTKTMTPRGDGRLIDMTYHGNDLNITETTYTLPGENVLIRDYEIQNIGDTSRAGSLLQYGRINVNNNEQNFVIWESNWNQVDAADDITWNDLEGPWSLRMTGNRKPDRSTLSLPLIELLDLAGDVTSPVPDDINNLFDEPLEFGLSLFNTVEQTVQDWFGISLDLVQDPYTLPIDSIVGRYIGGQLEYDYELAPGESEHLSIILAGGTEDDVSLDHPLLDTDQTSRQAAIIEDAAAWVDNTPDLPRQMQQQYRQCLTTLGNIFDPETGSFPAAPNQQPMYYPVWIRDASFMAWASATAGKHDMAKQYLAEFCPQVQETDGGFEQCYLQTGPSSAVIERANDQQAIYVAAVHHVFKQTGDEEFLDATWQPVMQALQYTENAVVDNGLLAATPDIAEMPTDVRQSLWTNLFAYQAFKAGSELADRRSDHDAAAHYREQARELGDAIEHAFFDDDVTVYGLMGGENDESSYMAAPVWLTDWADDYGYTEALADRLWEANHDTYEWLPGALSLTGLQYRVGEPARGDHLFTTITQATAQGGDLYEKTDPHGGAYALPLGWSQAMYLLTAHERPL